MKNIKIYSLLMLTLLFVNCSEDEVNKPLADFQFLVEGTQVTFNGTVENATSISWDFGDGATSSEEDPVYAYAAAGEYEVVLTATGANGSFSETKLVTIQESIEILLTGGQAKPQGKSWKLKKAYTSGKEGAGLVDNDLGLLLPSFDNLLDAVGLGASYEDTFTFVYDGRYIVDNKDGQSLMGLVYASIERPTDITAVSYDINNVPLANVMYTPATDATWEIMEGDFTVDAATGPVNFTDKTQLMLGEYLGFKDKKVLVIIKEITATTMNVALGIHTEPTVYDKPTLLFHLSLESL
ncbi:PKD domain-containing protein [Hwangdonia lutea]|uniref:PKD domain-containing protein n=1 Tax=Hwangdonia lutea TaxID=3075823 RepID=A0AA97ELU3_9FLAO|nr:PKD domain-containing protein [Hwangdonia sp. SCSIO 19198]WOD43869.1 PKD domain-containing protein [Hwangdonia sp. SCSIO 19198]